MTFICLNIELRTQPLIILVVIAGTDKERPGCSKILLEYRATTVIDTNCNYFVITYKSILIVDPIFHFTHFLN